MIGTVDQTPSTAASGAWRGRIDGARLARAAGLPEGAVRVVDSIDSTNAELMRQPPPASAPAERVLVAGVQTAGRGRRGRTWLSDPDVSLTLSVALHRRREGAAAPLAGLPLALGVAIAEAFSPWVPGIGLKWPNDLQCDGRKVAGVLIETRPVGDFERVVVGVGLNLGLPPSLADALDQPAAGLLDGLTPAPDRQEVAQRLVDALLAGLQRFFRDGFADTASRWRRFDVLAGREVVVTEQGAVVLRGQADGVDDGGALRVRTGDGVVVPVAAGDVSVRLNDPRPACRVST
jgi:BirA family biotin operon repressor/biotin-[acetyl-CoA-carboxylase] ligase